MMEITSCGVCHKPDLPCAYLDLYECDYICETCLEDMLNELRHDIKHNIVYQPKPFTVPKPDINPELLKAWDQTFFRQYMNDTFNLSDVKTKPNG